MRKNKLLLAAGLFLLTTCYAQEEITITTYYPSPNGSYNELTTTGNTYLATTEPGLVGIGTTNPSSKLTVEGFAAGDALGSGLGDLFISVQNTSSHGNGGILVRNDSGNSLFLSNRGSAHANNRYGLPMTNLQFIEAQNASAFVVGTNNSPLIFGTQGAERMRITPSGNVGIGTTNPTTALQVVGSAPIISVKDRLSGGVELFAQAFNNQSGVIGTTTGHPLALYTGGSEKVWVLPSGNVGIGTAAPAARLDVAGTIMSSTKSNVYTTTTATLTAWQPACNAGNALTMLYCTSGCSRFCNNKGYSAGVLVESNDPAEVCACIP